jgi:hypothetical protein
MRDHREFETQEAERRMVGLGRSEAAGITALIIILLVVGFARRISAGMVGVPMTDDREQQIRRAREVLSDAGWLFDDFVNNEMRKVLVSQPEERDQREEAYRRARVATEMKAGLENLIESYEADARLKERRELHRRI